MVAGSLLVSNGHGQGFSIESTSADTLNTADVKIEDMSKKVLQHRESVVAMPRGSVGHKRSVTEIEGLQKAERESSIVSGHSQKEDEDSVLDDIGQTFFGVLDAMIKNKLEYLSMQIQIMLFNLYDDKQNTIM